MSRTKQIIMAGGTFAVALGIGFVMQNGDALASRLGNDAPPPAATEAVAPITMPDEVSEAAPMAETAPMTVQDVAPVQEAGLAPKVDNGPMIVAPKADDVIAAIAVPEVEQAPDRVEAPVQIAAVETDTPVTDAILEDVVAAEACTVEMIGAAVEMVMVDLFLSAPCQPNAAATIHHQGMMFTVVTDDEGNAEFTSPSLAEMAVFIAAFDNGEGAVATLATPEVANYDRAVLQWSGDTGLQLHALEFGAEYGQDGHVWSAAMGDMDGATTGANGFMSRMGTADVDAAFMVEVYSFPSGMGALNGDVVLSVEAEITAGNCGREIAAQSIQITPGAETQALDLTMVMPDCDAVGDFILLKNMFQDLTLASR